MRLRAIPDFSRDYISALREESGVVMWTISVCELEQRIRYAGIRFRHAAFERIQIEQRKYFFVRVVAGVQIQLLRLLLLLRHWYQICQMYQMHIILNDIYIG